MRTLPSPRPAHYPAPVAASRCRCRRPAPDSTLRQLRRAQGLTLKQLASRAGVPCCGLVSRWEYGDCRPRPATAVRVAAVLGTTPASLFAPDGGA